MWPHNKDTVHELPPSTPTKASPCMALSAQRAAPTLLYEPAPSGMSSDSQDVRSNLRMEVFTTGQGRAPVGSSVGLNSDMWERKFCLSAGPCCRWICTWEFLTAACREHGVFHIEFLWFHTTRFEPNMVREKSQDGKLVGGFHSINWW